MPKIALFEPYLTIVYFTIWYNLGAIFSKIYFTFIKKKACFVLFLFLNIWGRQLSHMKKGENMKMKEIKRAIKDLTFTELLDLIEEASNDEDGAIVLRYNERLKEVK